MLVVAEGQLGGDVQTLHHFAELFERDLAIIVIISLDDGPVN